MIDPSANPDGWNKIVFAGVASPGTCTISGATKAIGWDIKNASGQTGAASSRKGEPIGKFTATFHLVDDPDQGSDFDEWDAFEELLWSSVDGEEPVALEVVHPDLQRLKWTAAVLASMGEMKLDGKGGATIKIGFIEHRPPKPKTTGSASKTKAGGGGSPAETEGDKKIRDAEKELQQLVDEGNELW